MVHYMVEHSLGQLNNHYSLDISSQKKMPRGNLGTLFILYTFDDPSDELNIGVFVYVPGSTGWSSAPSQTRFSWKYV